jgi:protein-S-isoprenylcysteine O-methyltransferase Ste14
MTAPNLISICWLIYLIYWAAKWKSVKQTKETAWRDPGYRWMVILVIGLIIIITHIFFPSINSLIFTFRSGPITPIQIFGIALTVIGLLICIVARKALADNWSSNIDLKKDHVLITSGIYRFVRHPIYTGSALMGIGSVIAEQSITVTVVYLGMIAFLIFKLKKEEELLIKHFPKEYPKYKKKTKALIPFLF